MKRAFTGALVLGLFLLLPVRGDETKSGSITGAGTARVSPTAGFTWGEVVLSSSASDAFTGTWTLYRRACASCPEIQIGTGDQTALPKDFTGLQGTTYTIVAAGGATGTLVYQVISR